MINKISGDDVYLDVVLGTFGFKNGHVCAVFEGSFSAQNMSVDARIHYLRDLKSVIDTYINAFEIPADIEMKQEQKILKHTRELRKLGYGERAVSEELAKRGAFSRNGKPFESARQ